MIREIKFRGKRIDNGDWIFGNLFIPDCFLSGKFICQNTTYANIAPSFEDGDNIEEAKKDGCSLGHFIEVIPETVGQYTGLKDKNGVKIYEGDIYDSYGQNYLVSFHNGAWCVGKTNYIHNVSPLGWEIDEDSLTVEISSFNEKLEVIGNIHEKPELLTNV